LPVSNVQQPFLNVFPASLQLIAQPALKDMEFRNKVGVLLADNLSPTVSVAQITLIV
jgi:hypothetical protein